MYMYRKKKGTTTTEYDAKVSITGEKEVKKRKEEPGPDRLRETGAGGLCMLCQYGCVLVK